MLIFTYLFDKVKEEGVRFVSPFTLLPSSLKLEKRRKLTK